MRRLTAMDQSLDRIPERSASRYEGQFAGFVDVERLFQILRDSLHAALQSGDPETARARYDLALECYGQLRSLGLPGEIEAQLEGFVSDLVERFPTAWRVNAALGLCERAAGMSDADAQRERLGEARTLLAEGLEDAAADPSALRALIDQIDAHLETLDGGSTALPQLDIVAPSADRESTPSHEPPEICELDIPLAAAEDAGAAEPALELGVHDRVHAAMFQGRGAPLHSIAIANDGDETLDALSLEITSEPPLISPSRLEIAEFAPGERLDLGPRRIASFLRYDHSVLRGLTESAPGSVRAKLTGRHGAVLAETNADWTVLPVDSWPGLGSMPELLAAYVLPNDAAVDGALSACARTLEASTNDSALDGYQSKDPVRALRIAESVYAALAGMDITYANPPASFETAGQRVRFPSKIASTRLATCFDLALFAAAILESAGLHPIVVLTEGHATVGAWLTERTFASPVVDELGRFTARIELTEIVVFDPTAATQDGVVPFESARGAALERLDDHGAFHAAIDVRRARLGGIAPLWMIDASASAPQPHTGHPATEGAPTGASSRDLDAEVAEWLEAERRRAREDETPATRLDRWLRQLLDLTMRNRLLAAPTRTKRVLPLLAANAGAIEDRLSDGKSFRVRPAPTEIAGIAEPTPRDLEPIRGLLEAGAKSGDLYAPLDESALAERLLHVYREARTAREEGGSNSLYLAIGFLVYRETKQTGKERRAPLLLVPLEIKRKSARKGFTLAIGADEPRVNVTLLEYLRRDHDIDVTGLDPLPTDDHGIDVPLVLRIFKSAIKDKDDWRVEDYLQVGLYSFAKYLLWRDLKDRESTLRENALARHLIERPSESFPETDVVPDPGALDEEVSAAEVFAPLSYDSTQLAAILAAANGATMVLEGPPGTGKSQTITNLIAHSIAHGKTVLFVSEKMAALDVVYKRLGTLGLGPACLELHSNKANKKAVLGQFAEAIEAGRVRGAKRRAWDEIAGEVDGARGRLNGHVAAMHTERRGGASVHELIGGLARGKGPEPLDVDLGDPREIESDTLAAMRRALDEIDVHGAEQLVDENHPLLHVGRTETSPLFESESRAVLNDFDAPAARFETAVSAILHALELRDAPHPSSADGVDALGALAASVRDAQPMVSKSYEWLRDEAALDAADEALEHASELSEIESAFEAQFRRSPRTLDLSVIETEQHEMKTGGFLKRWLRRRSLMKVYRGLAKGPREFSTRDLESALDRTLLAEKIETKMRARESDAAAVLGRAWEAAATNLEAARTVLARAREVHDALVRYATETKASSTREIASRLEPLLESSGGGLRAETEEFAAAWAEYGTARDELFRTAEPLAGCPDGLSAESVGALRACVRRWSASWGELRGWTRWQIARGRALELGLAEVVRAIESGSVRAGAARARFDAAFDAKLALHEISADDALKSFEGVEHVRAIERFAALDEERLDAAREEVRRRVATKRPTLAKLAETEEAARPKSKGATGLGLLQREIGKKSRHLAIRRLLAELGEVAMDLKPCFLMSPMSVAQYLDADHPQFDLVVFDEASQIPVWDAVGALARGEQAVIVGDPKQLPPTSFFARGEDEMTAEDDIQDLESILDECIGAQVPTHRLAWHYRSRHESLIAFSNERYYGGDLLTFPANGTAQKGVRVTFVESGVYEKGSSRTNPIEARAVVDAVVERLRGDGTKSIGVVTFNQAQQQLIQDLFEDAQSKDHSLEPYFDESAADGVFVKNLENVQGDERDVIVFSIGYGPDARGNVSMNFGPLNKEGGERRLNVAITRAREEVLVFTSLRSDQIDLARTSARGVRDLRGFLNFAERTTAVTRESSSRRSDELVESIAESLRDRGHEVDTEVGRSGVRIDLAIRDAEHANRYALAIETDGANYARAATARDRDKLRSEVLEGLGWTIERVWAVDWWRDRDREIARIESALEGERVQA